MKVLFQSRTNLFKAPGGDMVQMQKTKQYLEKLGVEVDISLEFEPDLTGYDVVHLFNLMEPQDIYRQYLNAKNQNKPIVLSTIYGLYTEYERNARGGFFQIIANILSPYQIGYIKTLIKHFYEKRFHKGVWKMLFKGYYKLMYEIVNGVDYLLPNSESEMQRVAKEFNLSNYNYFNVPNAIDIVVFNSDYKLSNLDIEKYGKFKDSVLCVARIEGRKSTLNLVKAFKDLPYQLVLVGNESKNQKEYVSQVHANSGVNVHYLGPVPHEDLAALYKLAKVHCLISWMETPGLSSLEAGAMNCNLVITDKGDTMEYFENLAEYCDPNDVESIKDAIIRSYNKNYNQDLRNKIITNYNWDNTAKITYQAYIKSIKN